MLRRQRRPAGWLMLAAALALLGCGGGGGGDHPVAYQLVRVGDPGNPSDSTGFGRVACVFRIGKYAVTIAQYTAFLNAGGHDRHLRALRPAHGERPELGRHQPQRLAGRLSPCRDGQRGQQREPARDLRQLARRSIRPATSGNGTTSTARRARRADCAAAPTRRPSRTCARRTGWATPRTARTRTEASGWPHPNERPQRPAAGSASTSSSRLRRDGPTSMLAK
jgi:hypothetical protein